MGEAKDIWKRLFFVLYNNNQPDDDLPTMWTSFKAEGFQDAHMMAAIESFGHLLQEDVRDKLKGVCSSETNLLFSMKEDSFLKDDLWHLLFSAFRDKASGPIDSKRFLSLYSEGSTPMTMFYFGFRNFQKKN